MLQPCQSLVANIEATIDLGALPCVFCFAIQQSLGELVTGAGLEKILFYTHFQSRMRITEIIMSGKNDTLHGRIHFQSLFDQLQSAHTRHADVRDQDIRHDVGHAVDSVDGVGAHTADRGIVDFPVDQRLQPVKDYRFIINKQNFQHFYHLSANGTSHRCLADCCGIAGRILWKAVV